MLLYGIITEKFKNIDYQNMIMKLFVLILVMMIDYYFHQVIQWIKEYLYGIVKQDI